jgi:hypothetical protein
LASTTINESGKHFLGLFISIDGPTKNAADTAVLIAKGFKNRTRPRDLVDDKQLALNMKRTPAPLPSGKSAATRQSLLRSILIFMICPQLILVLTAALSPSSGELILHDALFWSLCDLRVCLSAAYVASSCLLADSCGF